MRFLAAILWIAGIILAKGFWWTVLAVVVPFYAYWVVIKHALAALGWL